MQATQPTLLLYGRSSIVQLSMALAALPDRLLSPPPPPAWSEALSERCEVLEAGGELNSWERAAAGIAVQRLRLCSRSRQLRRQGAGSSSSSRQD